MQDSEDSKELPRTIRVLLDVDLRSFYSDKLVPRSATKTVTLERVDATNYKIYLKRDGKAGGNFEEALEFCICDICATQCSVKNLFYSHPLYNIVNICEYCVAEAYEGDNLSLREFSKRINVSFNRKNYVTFRSLLAFSCDPKKDKEEEPPKFDFWMRPDIKLNWINYGVINCYTVDKLLKALTDKELLLEFGDWAKYFHIASYYGLDLSWIYDLVTRKFIK